MFRLYNIN